MRLGSFEGSVYGSYVPVGRWRCLSKHLMPEPRDYLNYLVCPSDCASFSEWLLHRLWGFGSYRFYGVLKALGLIVVGDSGPMWGWGGVLQLWRGIPKAMVPLLLTQNHSRNLFVRLGFLDVNSTSGGSFFFRLDFWNQYIRAERVFREVVKRRGQVPLTVESEEYDEIRVHMDQWERARWKAAQESCNDDWYKAKGWYRKDWMYKDSKIAIMKDGY